MNIVLVAFIVVVIALLALLFYLLIMNKNVKKVKLKKESTKDDTIENIDLNNLAFPKNIENMNSDSLFKSSKVIFDSYKALSYVNNLPSSLDKIEWHTWQISILLVFLKNKNKLLIIDSNDKLFHNFILELNETQMNQDMQRIYKKYLENVNIHKNRDDLSKDVIWTARDVSIILYKIINHK
ncbi:MAG: hypothetical protein U5K55_16885 [Aliarcobacter sp.]|nr:hypothetical protein [Aliarcobacter sp.]